MYRAFFVMSTNMSESKGHLCCVEQVDKCNPFVVIHPVDGLKRKAMCPSSCYNPINSSNPHFDLYSRIEMSWI